MNIEFYLQNVNDGTVYDISELSQEITVTSSIEGEAGKLTCILEKDPNNLLQIANGSIVSLIIDSKGVFFGYVFTIGTDAEQNYKITCYDQMRYLKNKDVYTTVNMTASDIFAKVCKDYNLRYKIKTPTNYVPVSYVHDNKTLYSIINRGMSLASINDKKHYYVKDEFGYLVWSDLGAEKTNIQLGENTLLTGYKYEKSIDNNTYNQVKLFRNNNDTGGIDVWMKNDINNIKRWGILQYTDKVDDKYNSSQLKELAEKRLKILNTETETLKLQGDGILELTAGRGVKFVLDREKIDKWMWIKSATHRFTKYEHTMELEMEI